MNRLLIFLFVLIGSIFGVFYFSPEDKLSEGVKQASLPKTINSVKQAGKSEENIKLKPANKVKENELSNINSDDLILEMSALSQSHYACYTHYVMKKVNEKVKQANNYFSNIQTAYYQSVGEECEELNLQNPEYHFSLGPNERSDMWQSEPVGRLAKFLIKDFKDVTLQESEELLTTVADMNPDLIMVILQKSYIYKIEVIEPEIKMLIQSTDALYLNKISLYASNLMACELGANCGRFSQVMYLMCTIEENFCVNDFIELYNNRLTAGVKADVQLALAYYKKLFKLE